MIEWLVVGLGNYEKRYENTRHNVGFMVVEEMGKRKGNKEWRIEQKFKSQAMEGENILLLKPQTFMNRSGEAVVAAMRYFRLESKQLIVIHDDLDIALGSVKTTWARGPKAHNGILSVEEGLKSDQFWRIRVGVETRTSDERGLRPAEMYVLEQMNRETKDVLAPALVRAADEVEQIIHGRSHDENI
jgi:PTH1 family peptidyl-tRNA hydrolase